MMRSILGCGALLACLGWARALPAAQDQEDLATDVRAVFSAKCAGCHGPNLAKPKGRFGYVLDLERVAGNREMVVPSSPDESELWDLVRRDEMPPADSPAGSLSAKQKEVIRAWIAAGAPTVASGAATSDQSPDPEGQDSLGGAPTPSVAKRILGKLGIFHILVVHFPIALLIAAAAAEFWAALHRSRLPAPAVRFCVLLGTAGALAAAALGWLHAWNGYGAGMPTTLGLHRWIGTAAAAWAVGTASFSECEERRGVRSHWFRVWLLLGAVLIGVSAHLGGILVHGEDFFTGG
jgi:mono/diheme cytochrome c family protein/uncharacterized membrane protein